ncbi:MAG: dimethyl sulfoxide reductase anchor subunit [Proteobacteria bacterium]|nr:dimethyl sulfoxide reductase anchor subunit [Pseudomonadota bacterium]
MNPAFSVIFLTTLSGTAQGVVVALALAALSGVPMSRGYQVIALGCAAVLAIVALAASFFHLGRPERAWRAAARWRTSWLSREVIVLPAFIAAAVLWAWLVARGTSAPWPPLLALLLAVALWVCTAMIYACLRFIAEWAHPFTLVTFSFTGLAAGLTLACALAATLAETPLLAAAGASALVATLLAGVARVLSLRRNAALKPRSTLRTATGITATPIRQISMGMSAGAFNTREFFHHATAATVRNVKLIALVAGFVLPAACIAWALATGAIAPWWLAVLVQAPGLVADRWLFFAQARHPQNLYYQRVA